MVHPTKVNVLDSFSCIILISHWQYWGILPPTDQWCWGIFTSQWPATIRQYYLLITSHTLLCPTDQWHWVIFTSYWHWGPPTYQWFGEIFSLPITSDTSLFSSLSDLWYLEIVTSLWSVTIGHLYLLMTSDNRSFLFINEQWHQVIFTSQYSKPQ